MEKQKFLEESQEEWRQLQKLLEEKTTTTADSEEGGQRRAVNES